MNYSRLIISFKHINSPNKYQFRGAKETGAFLLLSGASSSGVIAVQLHKERLKYLLAPEEVMAKAGFAAIDGAQAFIKHYRAMVDIEKSDERNRQLDEEGRQAREGTDIIRSINKILDRFDVNLPAFLDSNSAVEKKRLKQALFEDWKALDALHVRAKKNNDADLVQKIGILKKRLERVGVSE